MLTILTRVTKLVDPIVVNPIKITSGEVVSQLNKFGDYTTNTSWLASWAQTPVAHAIKMGLISPSQFPNLAPSKLASRGEAAMMIKRALDYTLSMN
jgi:hypothetical protein